MSYNTVAEMARDYGLKERVAACASTEGEPEPVLWAEAHMWRLAGSPGWDAAYFAAVQANRDEPGKAEDVITDGMILAAVQILRTA